MASVFDHTSEVCLGAEVDPKMPPTESNTVPDGNSPFPHNKLGSGDDRNSSGIKKRIQTNGQSL